MLRASVLAASLALVACHPAASTPERAYYPLADDPPPAASERCFRHRLQLPPDADSAWVEIALRLRTDPAARTVTLLESWRGERGGDAHGQSTTVMSIDSSRFTAVEKSARGEAHGEGTLEGAPWAWTAWTGVMHHAGGDSRFDARFTETGLELGPEASGPEGSEGGLSRPARYAEVACATLADDPIETLYPKPKP